MADGREKIVARGNDRIGVRSFVREVRVRGLSFVREEDLEALAALGALALERRIGSCSLACKDDVCPATLPHRGWVRSGRLFEVCLVASRLQDIIRALAGDPHHRIRSHFDRALLGAGCRIGLLPLDPQALVSLFATRLTTRAAS